MKFCINIILHTFADGIPQDLKNYVEYQKVKCTKYKN